MDVVDVAIVRMLRSQRMLVPSILSGFITGVKGQRLGSQEVKDGQRVGESSGPATKGGSQRPSMEPFDQFTLADR